MRSLALTAVTIGFAIAGLAAQGHNHTSRASAELDSTQETPAVISPSAAGTFTAVIDDNAQTIQYQLRFDGLEAPVTQSHIHIAQPDVSGSIVVWLCQTAAAPDPVNTQTQQCPVNGGTITGTIVPSDVRTVAAQGFASTLSASDKFDRLVTAIRSGNAYANVHTSQSPAGEIRGQIKVKDRGDHGDHDD
jgi:hypothetical protein